MYRKKLLSSKPENWTEIATLIKAPQNIGTLLVLTGHDYDTICSPPYREVARDLLDSLVGRPHVIFVHEAVFLTPEQRRSQASETVERASLVDVNPRFDYEDYFGMTKDEFFGEISQEKRDRVNSMLRERGLNVVPYQTNVERSIMASAFIEDNERHLLFRLYVPNGRLYAQEAETLLRLFREWLGQTGRRGVRQEGYSTTAGQVIEFFSDEGVPEGGITRYFEDFSLFLDVCVSDPDQAIEQLTRTGIDASAAGAIVSRFATQARRLTLDLKQRREERALSLKHQFENLMLEADKGRGRDIDEIIDAMLPPAVTGGIVQADPSTPIQPVLMTNYQPQFISQVSGTVVQSVAGTVHLGPEAHALLELIASYGGEDRAALETAVHELEDEGARGGDRITARARLKRFLADLGNRGMAVGLDVLQKYIEHKVGVS